MRHTSNCVAFAAGLWRRLRPRNRKGRDLYVCIRVSRLADKGPHVLIGRLTNVGAEQGWRGLIRVVSYKPIEEAERKWPPPCFDGHVKWGDKP